MYRDDVRALRQKLAAMQQDLADAQGQRAQLSAKLAGHYRERGMLPRRKATKLALTSALLLLIVFGAGGFALDLRIRTSRRMQQQAIAEAGSARTHLAAVIRSVEPEAEALLEELLEARAGRKDAPRGKSLKRIHAMLAALSFTNETNAAAYVFLGACLLRDTAEAKNALVQLQRSMFLNPGRLTGPCESWVELSDGY
jgi:hypothetical protein